MPFFEKLPNITLSPLDTILLVGPRATLFSINWAFEENEENFEKYIRPWYGEENYKEFFKKSHALSNQEYKKLKRKFEAFALEESIKLIAQISKVLGNELLPFLSDEVLKEET